MQGKVFRSRVQNIDHFVQTSLWKPSSFSVTPETESVHIGVSNHEYTDVDDLSRAEMAQCLVLKPVIPLDSDLNQACATGIHGRYIYISLIRGSNDLGKISLYEVRVYMGKLCRTHMYTSFQCSYTDLVFFLFNSLRPSDAYMRR